VRRGRKHAALSAEDLSAAWQRAYLTMAQQPFSEAARRGEGDLHCEFELRGTLPPLTEVADAQDELIKSVSEAYERSKGDPERFREGNEALQRDIDAFKARRDRPKN